MKTASTPPPSERNRLLLALPPDELAAIDSRLELIDLPADSLIAQKDGRIGFVHFPQTVVLSSLTVMQNGDAVEACTTGFEGFVGVPVLLGGEVSSTRLVAQVPGFSRRVAASAFPAILAAAPSLRRILERYVITMITEISVTAACNRLHSLEQRCARWLLLTHDRVMGDAFQLTQEYLASMLGVRRAGVSGVAGKLQAAALIKYSRGRIMILDRAGLQGVVCECYTQLNGTNGGNGKHEAHSASSKLQTALV
jgi:hypothetical protein